MAVEIPIDMYESKEEIVIIIPLWWVLRSSIKVQYADNRLSIFGSRKQPKLKEWLVSIEDNCYWGDFARDVVLPPNIYHEKVHVQLRPENTMIVIVPKMLIPEKIDFKIEYL